MYFDLFMSMYVYEEKNIFGMMIINVFFKILLL